MRGARPLVPPLHETGELLAVLGRGIQTIGGSWRPSPDLEVFGRADDGRWVHSAIPLGSDDSDPRCLIGGGQLNVDAAVVILTQQRMPCVLGYAHPAEYLRRWNGREDGPSESGPMSEALRARLAEVEIMVWTGEATGDSNTEVEVRNVMALAKRMRARRVRFLTVSPHVARATVLAQLHQSVDFTVEASDTILLQAGSDQVHRVGRMHRSAAYWRTVESEHIGTVQAIRRLLAKQTPDSLHPPAPGT